MVFGEGKNRNFAKNMFLAIFVQYRMWLLFVYI